jgi:predicted DNA-binding protein
MECKAEMENGEKKEYSSLRLRMSFLFPKDFYMVLSKLKEKTGMDMTYIIMDAVNKYAEDYLEDD